MNDGGPAFPRAGGVFETGQDGMSLRDFYAGLFGASMAASEKSCQEIAERAREEGVRPTHMLVIAAFDFAEAMIAERALRLARERAKP
jgi:hypothetical protein